MRGQTLAPCLARDRHLETQATATCTKIKGQQAGDKVLFSLKQNVHGRDFLFFFFFSCIGQAELFRTSPSPGTKAESATTSRSLGELCKHSPCTQTVKHNQDLEFWLWHLVMPFNETTGNEVVIFSPPLWFEFLKSIFSAIFLCSYIHTQIAFDRKKLL